VLLVTSSTPSRYLAPDDKSGLTIFGDAAAATLVSDDGQAGDLGPFVYGTDSLGADHIRIDGGAFRNPGAAPVFHMDGPEVFAFSLRAVPEAVSRLLENTGLAMEEVDHFVLHQANGYMLSNLRKRMRIPPEKFVVSLEETGNTLGASIPIALSRALEARRILPGQNAVLVGFGTGFAWGAALARW